LKFQEQGRDVFCDEEYCSYGKRGIKLRTFRTRHRKEDIIEAKRKAEAHIAASPKILQNKEEIYGAPSDDPEDPERELDENVGLGELDTIGKPVGTPLEKAKDFVLGKDALRVRGELGKVNWDDYSPEQIRALEAIIGPLKDYLEKPFKEGTDIA